MCWNYIQVKAIGAFNDELNVKYSAKIAEFIHQSLAIAPEKCLIEFVNLEPQNVSNSGTTMKVLMSKKWYFFSCASCSRSSFFLLNILYNRWIVNISRSIFSSGILFVATAEHLLKVYRKHLTYFDDGILNQPTGTSAFSQIGQNIKDVMLESLVNFAFLWSFICEQWNTTWEWRQMPSCWRFAKDTGNCVMKIAERLNAVNLQSD